jgi:hypothetical protein
MGLILHHTNDGICFLCLQKLRQADPQIADWFKTIKTLYPTVHISCSWRSAEDQEKAFAESKTKLHWPKSAHNAINEQHEPASRALDLFNLSLDGVAIFPPLFYAKIWHTCQDRKDPIQWGGNFKTLGDSDHFQLD